MKRRNFILTLPALALRPGAAATPRNHAAAARQVTAPSLKTLHIIHGYGATPDAHWFRWLGDKARAEGVRVSIPALPQPQAPAFADWQQALADSIGMPDERDIFVAHSLGTISLLHYLNAARPARIGGLVLVSGFAGRLPGLSSIDGYSVDAYVDQARIDVAAIRTMTPHITSIISSNDPIVAPQDSRQLAQALHSRIVQVDDGGHFLDREGFTQLQPAWQAVKALLT